MGRASHPRWWERKLSGGSNPSSAAFDFLGAVCYNCIMQTLEKSLTEINQRTADGIQALLKDRMTPEELCDFSCWINLQLCKAYSQGGRDLLNDMKEEGSNG